MSTLATVAGKSFHGKFTSKFDFPIGYTIADGNIGSLKSLHTYFDKSFDHMLVKFEQNRMVQTTQDSELFGKKVVNHFWQSVDAILKDFCDWNNCLMLSY